MDFFYRKLGKLIAPVVVNPTPIQLLNKKAILETLSFFDRKELDALGMVSRQFNTLVNEDFKEHPYRMFYTLDIQIDAARESPPCKVDFREEQSVIYFFSFHECLEIFKEHKNVRFSHTKFLYARKLPQELNDELDEFLATFTHLTHLWEGQKLDVYMMPWDRQRAPHFKRIFTNFVEGCSELYIRTPERQDFPLQIVFDYPDVKVADSVKIDAFSPPSNFIAEAGGLLNILHKPNSKTMSLTFTRGGDQQFFKQLIGELKKRFQSSSTHCTYKLFLVGLHSASFYSVQPFILDNEATGEQFKVIKETGDFNLGYRIARVKVRKGNSLISNGNNGVEERRERKRRPKEGKDKKMNSASARVNRNEPAAVPERMEIEKTRSFEEQQQNIKFSFC